MRKSEADVNFKASFSNLYEAIFRCQHFFPCKWGQLASAKRKFYRIFPIFIYQRICTRIPTSTGRLPPSAAGNPSMTNQYGQVMSSVLMHPPELNHVLPTHPSASPPKGRPPRADGGPITFGLGEDLRTHPRTVSHLPWPKLTSSWARKAYRYIWGACEVMYSLLSLLVCVCLSHTPWRMHDVPGQHRTAPTGVTGFDGMSGPRQVWNYYFLSRQWNFETLSWIVVKKHNFE